MKNKFLLGTLLMCIASLFTACSDDNDSNPTLLGPTSSSFTVNTPAVTDQLVSLEGNTVHLTWSQAVYNYAAYISYRVQVGVIKSDGSIKWNTDADTGANKYLESVYHQCTADLSGEELAWAINNADGITSKDNYDNTQGPRKIALRLRATIDDGVGNEQSGTEVFSNTVYLNKVQNYAAVKEPGWIYVVGSLNNWKNPVATNSDFYKDYRLTETKIGNKIYEGTFTVAAGDLQFRFYTDLTDWDGGASIGTQTADSPIDCSFTSGVYEGNIMEGKGSYKFAGFAGGKVKMTVNLNTNKVTFAVVE